MEESLRLYLRYISLSVQSQLQYRASFLMLTSANFIVTFSEFFGTVALFNRFGSLKGWTLSEVMLFYGVIHVAFALSESWARGFDVVHKYVRQGEFDRMLLRPRSTVLQVLGQDFQLLRLGRLSQGVLVFLYGASASNLQWTLSKLLLLVFSVVGGMLLFSGLFVLQGAISFWSVDSIMIANTFTYGGTETAQFPLSIYRAGFREFFIFVLPLASVNYFPVLAIIGRADPLGYPGWIPWISPAIGLAFFSLCIAVWNVGVRHYHSTGS